MSKKNPNWSRKLNVRTSLRAKVAMGVAFPLLVILSILSFIHYVHGRQILEDQLELSAQQLGEITLGSLNHAMLINDREMLKQALTDVERMENIQQVQIIDLRGGVIGSDGDQSTKQILGIEDPDCQFCHQFQPNSRPRTAYLEKTNTLLRISAPISNEPACRECHAENSAHLGVLLIDASMVDLKRQLMGNLRVDLAVSAAGVTLVTAGLYALIHVLIIRRMDELRGPLAQFASGKFTYRLPHNSRLTDEFDDLAHTFNQMADQLETHIQEEEDRRRVRLQTIIEERERIARELHDGLAQLLGYVNTKALAVRLHLKKKEWEAADLQLSQLEEASRELYKETREAIYDLRVAGDATNGLIETLESYTKRFSSMSNLTVTLKIEPEVANVWLPMEKELHLLRIIQEALTNCRKHAVADAAWVTLGLENGSLRLVIQDNGRGFSPAPGSTDHRPYFGLSIMRERSEEIGAEFELKTEPGAGTQVSVRLPLSE